MSTEPNSRYAAGLPDLLHLQVGQTGELPLVGAVGGGYEWTATAANETVEVEVRRLPPARAETAPGGTPPGSSGMSETLVVSGREVGVALVELRLARSWLPGTPLATHVLRVVVQ